MTEKTSITLAADETVLFVHPYSREEIDEVQFAADSLQGMQEVYRDAAQRDPGFTGFVHALNTVADELGLDIGMVFDDCLMVIGDEQKLEIIKTRFEGRYAMEYGQAQDITAMTEEARVLNDEIDEIGGWDDKPVLN